MSNEQQKYIAKVEEVAINPLSCSNYHLNSQTQTYTPGKRYPLETYELKDLLSVASNQLVFELDARSYTINYEYAKRIIEVLEEKHYPHYIFASGGKGIHIECWFDKPEITDDNIKTLFLEALSYQLSFKHIRLWLWNSILDDAGFQKDICGIGKLIDSSCLVFDDLNDKTRLLRVAGGRKITYNTDTGKSSILYKTFIPKLEFKSKKIQITRFEDVKFPEKLEMFKINQYEFSDFLKKYIETSKNSNTNKLVHYDLKDTEGYFNLESVKKIREGLPRGQRAMGAQILAIAMSNDGFAPRVQERAMEEYVAACSQIGSKFSVAEAKQWLKWINAQTKVFWNCALPERLGIHDSRICEYCKKAKKKELKALKDSEILNKIANILKKTVAGEERNLVLLFLLMLTKDFPEDKTWNIKSDPKSQAVILNSDSASGKSYVIKSILPIFGEEDVDYYVISRITKAALNYFDSINLDGKIIFIEELQGVDQDTNQLRLWISEGKLRLLTTEKSNLDETHKLVMKKTQGMPSFVTCTAEDTIEHQLSTRIWTLGMDTTITQTNKILDFTADMLSNTTKSVSLEMRHIRDILRELKPYHFIIPFAKEISMAIQKTGFNRDLRIRRDFSKFLTVVQASAYLHQYQRDKYIDEDGREYIICDLQDFDVAKKCTEHILSSTFQGLSNQHVELLNQIKQQVWSNEFEAQDVQRLTGKSQSKVWSMLKHLEELGFITANRGNRMLVTYSINQGHQLKSLNFLEENTLRNGISLSIESAKAALLLNTSNKTGENEQSPKYE